MNWNNSIFGDNYDSSRMYRDEQGNSYDRNDLMNPRETTNWEKDLVAFECEAFERNELATEPDLDQ